MPYWWICFLQTDLLHKIWHGLYFCDLLVDYCDVFISCLDSHSDGTHSLNLFWCRNKLIYILDGMSVCKYVSKYDFFWSTIHLTFMQICWSCPIDWQLSLRNRIIWLVMSSFMSWRDLWCFCIFSDNCTPDDAVIRVNHFNMPTCKKKNIKSKQKTCTECQREITVNMHFYWTF